MSAGATIGVPLALAVVLGGVAAWASHGPRPQEVASPAVARRGTVAGAPWEASPHDDRRGDLRDEGIAAIDRASRGDVTSAVTVIGRTDLAADGRVAARAIRVLATLSARASSTDRARIGERLAAWLAAEHRRGAPDALGNVAVLAEELGRVHHPTSTHALLTALDAADLPLFVEARIVASLGELADPVAAPAVARFRARLPAPTGEDAFEDALRREAREIAEVAQERISRG